jgi:hypothetical protein
MRGNHDVAAFARRGDMQQHVEQFGVLCHHLIDQFLGRGCVGAGLCGGMLRAVTRHHGEQQGRGDQAGISG